MSKNQDQLLDDIAAKVVAAETVRMATHLEFDTEIHHTQSRKIIAMFQPYWRGDISFSQLMEALRLIGYGADLDADGLHQFINKGDLH
jgi:hypothetical protein